MNTSSTSVFDKISLYVLAGVAGLLPILFFPYLNFPVEFSKSYIFVIGIVISFLFWVIARLIDGVFVVPKTPLLISGGAVIVLAFFSAIFSPSLLTSFSGVSFGVGTFVSLFTLFLAFFLASVHFKDSARVSYFYIALFASFVIMTIFELIFFFFAPKALMFGAFFAKTTTMIGSLNDLAVFYGLIAILSLFTLELFRLPKNYKIILAISLFFSLFFLAVVNFLLVWVILGVLSLILFVYVLTIERSQHTTENAQMSFPFASFFVILISLLFILGNSFIGPALSSYLHVSETNIRPSVPATFSVLKNVAVHDPIFGTGPNRFDAAWSLYKPKAINTSAFWDASFVSGFGFLPTLIVTLGILGGLAMLVFLGFFILIGARKGFSFGENRISNYLITSSFLCALYLWIFVLVYNPGTALIALTFVFSGIFIGLIANKGDIETYTVNFLKDPRHSFFAIFALVVVMIGSIGGLYFSVQRVIGTSFFYHGAVKAFAKGDQKLGESKVFAAATLTGNDVYYRSLTEVYISDLKQLLSRKNLTPDAAKVEFQKVLSSAESVAQKAISIDATDSANWLNLGHVYQAVVPLGVTGAYENADGAYQEAQKRNPVNPGILLERARLDMDNKNNDEARKRIAEALALKPNYTDAFFLLSQIEVAEGNVGKAIEQVSQAAIIEPNNSGIFFQLGLLRYNIKDYQGAANAFLQAIAIQKDYYNAHYFLGLSYDKIGATAKAIEEFTYLHNAMPTNDSINTALTNLQSGRSALESADQQKETPPEKGKELPVKEKNQ